MQYKLIAVGLLRVKLGIDKCRIGCVIVAYYIPPLVPLPYEHLRFNGYIIEQRCPDPNLAGSPHDLSCDAETGWKYLVSVMFQ